MPQKDPKKYLHDVLQAIEGIEQISAGLTINDLNKIANKWALERGISIIGEALYKANNIDRTLLITDLSKIIATRHIVIHDYDIVDSARLFAIIQNHLPLLKEEIENILKKSV
jgi:uncharacterized protein with HEPN domain